MMRPLLSSKAGVRLEGEEDSQLGSNLENKGERAIAEK